MSAFYKIISHPSFKGFTVVSSDIIPSKLYSILHQCVQCLTMIRSNLCFHKNSPYLMAISRQGEFLFHTRVESKLTNYNIRTSICCSLTEKLGVLYNGGVSASPVWLAEICATKSIANCITGQQRLKNREILKKIKPRLKNVFSLPRCKIDCFCTLRQKILGTEPANRTSRARNQSSRIEMLLIMNNKCAKHLGHGVAAGIVVSQKLCSPNKDMQTSRVLYTNQIVLTVLNDWRSGTY